MMNKLGVFELESLCSESISIYDVRREMYLVNYIERHLCSGTDSRYQTELVKAPSMDKGNEHPFSIGQGATPWP